MSHTVILDPQWLIDAFSAIVRDTSLHIKPGDRKLMAHPAYRDYVQRGILFSDILPAMWPETEYTVAERDLCLQLMIRHHLLVKMEAMSTKERTAYLVPSLLPQTLRSDIPSVRNHLSDGLSRRFKQRLQDFTGPKNATFDEADNVSCFFVFLWNEIDHNSISWSVQNIEQDSLLPGG
jgi:hypothetical protein